MKYILVAMVLVGCGSEPIVVATAPVTVETETPVVASSPVPAASPSPSPSLTQTESQDETTEIIEIPTVTEETDEDPIIVAEPVTEEPAVDDPSLWISGNKVWTYAGVGGHDQGPTMCDTRHFANVNELREAIDAGLLEHFAPTGDPARIWAFGAQFHIDGTLVTIADGYAPLDSQLHIFCWTTEAVQ